MNLMGFTRVNMATHRKFSAGCFKPCRFYFEYSAGKNIEYWSNYPYQQRVIQLFKISSCKYF